MAMVRAVDAEKWFAVTPASVEAAKAAREKSAAEKIVRLPVEKAAWGILVVLAHHVVAVAAQAAIAQFFDRD